VILYLCNGNNDMIQCRYVKDIACVDTKWKHSDIFRRRIDKLLFLYKLLPAKWVLGSWARKLDSYHVIIIEALKANTPLLIYIKEHAKKETRVILWHWNKISEHSILPQDDICSGCELWSFDMDDCQKYGMHYNTQYFDTAWVTGQEYEIMRDIWFIGVDKQRAPYLIAVKKEMEARGLTVDLHIVADKESKKSEMIVYKKKLPYAQSLYELSRSRAVLDVTLKGQSGLTLRPLEALFFGKKVITSNRTILDQPFYNQDNIFVIGIDDWDRLPAMLTTPFNTSIKTALEEYDVQKWLLRFGGK